MSAMGDSILGTQALVIAGMITREIQANRRHQENREAIADAVHAAADAKVEIGKVRGMVEWIRGYLKVNGNGGHSGEVGQPEP